MQFFVKEVYPLMDRDQVAIPPKQAVLFQKKDKGQKKVLARFDTFSIEVTGPFSVRVTDLQKESRMHAEMLAAFLNSKECTKKLRKAFLDSISKHYEKSQEKPVLSTKSLKKLHLSIARFSLLKRATGKW